MIQVLKIHDLETQKLYYCLKLLRMLLTAVEGGVDIQEFNVGSMAHSVGKVAVSKVLSIAENVSRRLKN